jgi:E3 ubiquitin-protein ligase DOA10
MSNNQPISDNLQLFKNDRCTIRYDEEYKVRISVKSGDDAQLIVPVNELVMDLNNMRINKKDRKKYGNDIKNIYQMALNKQEASAIEYANKLKNIMESNLLLRRKIEYTLPATISYIILIVLSYILMSYVKKNIFIIIIFRSLGGILSLLLKQKKI